VVRDLPLTTTEQDDKSAFAVPKGYETFQAMYIKPTSLFFQLFAHLRMKFGNVEAIDRIQIGKKKHLTKRQLHLQHR